MEEGDEDQSIDHALVDEIVFGDSYDQNWRVFSESGSLHKSFDSVSNLTRKHIIQRSIGENEPFEAKTNKPKESSFEPECRIEDILIKDDSHKNWISTIKQL